MSSKSNKKSNKGSKTNKKNIKKKYYAIKEGKGVKDKIVTTWTECKELVLCYPAVYKSFKTAKKTLAGIEAMHMIKKGQIKNSIKSVLFEVQFINNILKPSL